MYFSELLTNTIISLLFGVICFVFISILLPQCFYNSSQSAINIPLLFISCLYNTVFAMFMTLLTRKARISAMVSFIITVFVLLFTIILSQNLTLAYVFTFILPAYSIFYHFTLLSMEYPVEIGLLTMGVVMTCMQVLISLLVLNFDSIRTYVREKLQKLNKTHVVVDDCSGSAQLLNGDGEILLSIRDLHYVYGKRNHALKGVSVQVPRGCTFGLLGSNGSGKSTLINCISGILHPQRGRADLYCGGVPISLLGGGRGSAHVSVVPQHDIFWGNLTVFEHLQIMCNLSGNNADIGQLISLL